MKRISLLFMMAALLVFAGCRATAKRENLGHEGGEPYADVPVPDNYIEYDIPPFKRQDGADGSRIYGRYAYRSTDGINEAAEVYAWFSRELPGHGWEYQIHELDDSGQTMTATFTKGDDQLQLNLEPDNRVRGTERFSILTVEMNPQYD